MEIVNIYIYIYIYMYLGEFMNDKVNETTTIEEVSRRRPLQA